MIRTSFTERFGLDHPVALAPMDIVAGGALAAAVSAAGGLGIIGGGYGDPDWVEQAFQDAGNAPVGIGFITWSALKSEGLIDDVLSRSPKALMVSFGDAEPIIGKARQAGVPTLWQVQTFEQARQALASGTDVIVVQGQEGGGHGVSRGLTALLPAVRDIAGPDRIVLAAGGIADGRGLAAALMLGADGVLVGTRFWASREAVGPEAAKRRMVALGGDDTVRSKVFDVVRNVDWPAPYNGRVVRNAFLEKWHGDMDGLAARAEAERRRYAEADETDYETRVLIAGEALDLIHDIPPAGDIVRAISSAAEALLSGAPRYVHTPAAR